jgi:hypothetical protein
MSLYLFLLATLVAAYLSLRMLWSDLFPPIRRLDIDAADSDDLR